MTWCLAVAEQVMAKQRKVDSENDSNGSGEEHSLTTQAEKAFLKQEYDAKWLTG